MMRWSGEPEPSWKDAILNLGAFLAVIALLGIFLLILSVDPGPR